VLSYGLAPRSPAARAAWQEQTRRQLAHLIMAGNPAPLSSTPTTVRSDLPPVAGAPAPQRDDDPNRWPQSYRLNEVQFTYSLPNPDDASRPLSRRAHGYLAVPTAIPAGKKLRAVVALNDHGGSAWQVMSPSSEAQWYGDAFARRGFVVLALDVSHRDDSPLYKMSGGDDPANGNGAHPSIKAPGAPLSPWEEDGERAWDAMRALDYLQSLPYVDPAKVIVTGLSLGGEVATIAAALDPRFAMAIVAGYSPDLGVLKQRGAHPCWRWAKGDMREYIDVPDLFALIAPRPLVFETGKADFTVSPRHPVAAQKQIARRARAAYGDDVKSFVHYLHEGGSRYRVGGKTARGDAPEGVGTPDRIEPELPEFLAWQADTSTTQRWETLFDVIDSFLPAS
jgi:dienelactone hydrolase